MIMGLSMEKWVLSIRLSDTVRRAEGKQSEVVLPWDEQNPSLRYGRKYY